MVHRAVDNILDGFANGASGFVSSIANAVKGVGKSVMSGLDKPFTDLTGREGPHRILDRAADNLIDAGVNFLNDGVIGSAKIAGEGVMKAMDHPIEQVEQGISKLPLPKLFRK